MSAIYIAIVFVTCTVCAVAGIGGGVIIKPLFDAISPFSSVEISAVSLFSVLAMALSSTIRQVRAKPEFQKTWAAEIGIGSILGGILGQLGFDRVRAAFPDQAVKLAQSITLLALLTLVLIYTLTRRGQARLLSCRALGNTLLAACVSALCCFVGIGGGPINICLVSLLYGASVKEAAVYSLLMIVCSQGTKLITCVLDGTLNALPATLWPLIGGTALAGLLAGTLGARLNKIWSARAVHGIYLGVLLLLIIALSAYNACRLIF